MKITLGFLKASKARDEFIKWFKKQKSKELVDLMNTLIKEERHYWGCWLMRESFSMEQTRRYLEYEYKVRKSLKYADYITREAAMGRYLQYGLSLIKEGDS